MIDTNVRSLKRAGSGSFTLVPEGRTTSPDLCVKCARSVCSVRDGKDLSVSYGASMEVVSCRTYMPPLVFQDATGLIDGCNTMRLGLAWKNRLVIGDEVGLVSREGVVFGSAVVSRLLGGDLNHAIRNHAYRNHLFIGRDISSAEAAKQLKAKMPAIYGNLIYKNATKITVLYLDDVDIFNIVSIKIK